MKVVVTGSRHWNDYSTIVNVLSDLPKPLLVIHGNAKKGADAQTHVVCLALGLNEKPVNADWSKFGKGAGFKRNIEMLEMKPDLVIAFRAEGKSNGTDHTITEAKKRGIPVEQHAERK